MQRLLLAAFFLALLACNNATDNDRISADAGESMLVHDRTADHYTIESQREIITEQDALLTRPPKGFEYDIEYEQLPIRPLEKETAQLVNPVNAPDHPPLFKQSCLQEEDPIDCADRVLYDYLSQYTTRVVNKNTSQPDTVLLQFQLDESGVVIDETIETLAASKCQSCHQLSLNAVRQMPNWFPALQDGAPRAVRIRLPIIF